MGRRLTVWAMAVLEAATLAWGGGVVAHATGHSPSTKAPALSLLLYDWPASWAARRSAETLPLYADGTLDFLRAGAVSGLTVNEPWRTSPLYVVLYSFYNLIPAFVSSLPHVHPVSSAYRVVTREGIVVTLRSRTPGGPAPRQATVRMTVPYWGLYIVTVTLQPQTGAYWIRRILWSPSLLRAVHPRPPVHLVLYNLSPSTIARRLDAIPVYESGHLSFWGPYFAESPDGVSSFLKRPVLVVRAFCQNLLPASAHGTTKRTAPGRVVLTSGVIIRQTTRPLDAPRVQVQMTVPHWGRYQIALVRPSHSRGAYLIQRIVWSPYRG